MIASESCKKMVCKHCGSELVMADAWAVWDVTHQEWVLSTTFDNAWCDVCDGETSIEEKMIIET